MGRKCVQHTNMLRIQSVTAQNLCIWINPEPWIVTAKADITLILRKLPETRNSVFTYYFAHFAVYFQTVGAGKVTGGRDKDTGCPAWKFKIHTDIIFHFDIMPFSFVADRIN